MNDRYSRQIQLPQIGHSGQERIRRASVLLVGCGATGGTIAAFLVRAGVGLLRIADRDWVELNNLQRQILFNEDDARSESLKSEAAALSLSRVNSDVRIQPVVLDVTAATIGALLDDVDLVLDGADNFETRYLINDACVQSGKPWIYTGAVGAEGMSLFIHPGVSACFRCLFPVPPAAGSAATCDQAGVLGPAVGVIASVTAANALRWLATPEDPPHSDLICVDAWEGDWRRLTVTRKPNCPCCGQREFPYLSPDSSALAVSLCGRDAVQISPAAPANLDLSLIAGRLAGLGEVELRPVLLRFRSEDCRLTLFADGRTVVHDTDDPLRARALHARYVGA